jgi:hypothetical protein
MTRDFVPRDRACAARDRTARCLIIKIAQARKSNFMNEIARADVSCLLNIGLPAAYCKYVVAFCISIAIATFAIVFSGHASI